MDPAEYNRMFPPLSSHRSTMTATRTTKSMSTNTGTEATGMERTNNKTKRNPKLALKNNGAVDINVLLGKMNALEDKYVNLEGKYVNLERKYTDIKKENNVLKARLDDHDDFINSVRARHYFIYHLDLIDVKWNKIEHIPTRNAVGKIVLPGNVNVHPKPKDNVLSNCDVSTS